MEKDKRGVLDLLSVLEVKERQRKRCKRDHSLVELKDQVEALALQRDQLKAKIRAKTIFQKLLNRVGNDGPSEEEILDGTENPPLLLLMARHAQLTDLLGAHHLTGGYDVTQTRKGLCVSLATAFEGVYLDTYHLEMDLIGSLKIGRHDVPQVIHLESLAEKSNLQSNVKAFLDCLSQHLYAYAARKRQLALVKELHDTVQVMESNLLYSILVLLLSLPGDADAALLCTLEYADPTVHLPTGVLFESSGKDDAPCLLHWEEKKSLFLESPVHVALATLRRTGVIS